MDDVARLAGVSGQTVSRVINAHPQVSRATRDRVEKAIAELGYRRNSAARSLVTRRTHIIGVLAMNLNHQSPARTLLGVEQAARAKGYFVHVASLRDFTTDAIKDAFDYFAGQAVDGMLVIAAHNALLEALSTMGVPFPVVTVGFGAGEEEKPIAVDQTLGARLAVQHLVDRGHTAIAHVSGPAGWTDADARIEGWRSTLALAGLAASALIPGDWSAASGYRAGLELAAAGEVTALFAANDQMALGALRAIDKAGLSVPEDISVVGYDDQPEAAYFVPPLTTVRQDFEELGARSVDNLLAKIGNGGTAAATVVSPRLIVRCSTDCPPTTV